MNDKINMVFYRKYRPQKISELDNENIRESLTSIFSKNNSVHAFLFTGPKGLGKTSTARIVAKVINCTGRKDKSDVEPCNKCDQCISIANGNNLDILEIDGASNRGIDEIRDLREKIKLSPFKALKKIYIIDEVHMLTTEAFNALLKTLEEPPIHAVFILCTTELHKVPATIASRCFRLNFTKATNEELIRSLKRIVKEEEIKIEEEALTEISSLSDGSFRDGVKILEEVLSFAGNKKVTKDLVNEKYNMLGIGESVSKMLEHFHKKDVKNGIKLCQELENQGMDFKFFTEKLIERLHFMLLVEVGLEKGKQIFSLEEIKKLFELISEAYSQTKYAILPQTPLEIAIIEWGNINESVMASAVQESIEVKQEPIQKTASEDLPSVSFFTSLINEVKNHNNLFAGVLRGCKIEEIKNNKLTITASSKFHRDKIEEAKNLKLLEEALEKITGKNIKIEVILKSA